MRIPLCSCFGFLLFFSACYSPQTYSIDELANNHYNQLELTVTPDLPAEGFEAIFEQYQELELDALRSALANQPLELNQASFGLYYLANANAREGNMERALVLHSAAAEHYLNPQSYLKLAEREFFEVKDYAQAYYHLHHALELLVETTRNNRSHPLSRNTKDKAQFLLQELEGLGAKGYFDLPDVRQQLKDKLPSLMKVYRDLYQIQTEEPS